MSVDCFSHDCFCQGTYLPLCSGAVPARTIFPVNEDLCLSRQAGCTSSHNATLLTEQQLWYQYRLSPEALSNSTRIIFSVAEFDPTTAVVDAYPPLFFVFCRSRRIYTSGMAHREDLFLPTSEDKPEVGKVSLSRALVALCSWSLTDLLEFNFSAEGHRTGDYERVACGLFLNSSSRVLFFFFFCCCCCFVV